MRLCAINLVLMSLLAAQALAAQHDRGRILLLSQRVARFSSEAAVDTFRLVGIGSDTLYATMTFSIISPHRGVIYRQQFGAGDLIGYGLIPVPRKPSKSQVKAFIANRVAQFFADAEFFLPAIKPGMVLDSEVLETALSQELLSDSTSVGFHFLLGEENNRYIAYSKALKKTVVYFSHD
jgi:hypothetical protein